MHGKIFFFCLLAIFSTAFCKSILSNSVKDVPQIGNYLFEKDIREFLEKLRDILKNGDSEQGIPPMEPLPIPYFDFDFKLADSQLAGYIDKILAHNVSDFIITDVAFNPFGITLELGLRFENLTIDGDYELKGNIFEEIVNAEGSFISVTNTLDVDVFLGIGSNLDHSQVKELKINFSFLDDNFSNKVTGVMSGNLENSYLQPLLYRIRDEYFPLLENTLVLVGSDLIHDATLDEIIKVILDLIQGKGTELIKTN